MADIDIRRAHHFGHAAAHKAAQQMADHLGRKFGLAGDWDGDVLRFQRPGVTGSLTVGADDIHLSVTLGFLLKAMKGSIEQAIHHELDALFAGKPAAKESSATRKKASPPRKKGG
jgi:putative polyhydroxyalkanoate system protein